MRILALLPLACLVAVAAAPTASAWTIYTVGIQVQVLDSQGNVSPCVGVQARGTGTHLDTVDGVVLYVGPVNGPNPYAGARFSSTC